MEYITVENINISYITLFLVLLYTVALFYPVVKKTENTLKKIFIILLVVSYFVYSGLGISLLEDKGLYLTYYIIYTATLAFTFYIFRNKKINFKFEEVHIENFIHKYKFLFLEGYILLLLLLLVFPENKLSLLYNPPAVDISKVMEIVRLERKVEGFAAIITVLTNILMPFYYLSLIKYHDKPIKLFIYILIPIYIIYCNDEYIGRSTMVLNFLFYLAVLYYYNIEYRKRIVILGSIGLVMSLSFLSAYTYMRVGSSADDFTFMDSIKDLFVVECTFPLWFNDIYNNLNNTGETHITEYTLWLITQPIPGFLKSSFVDLNLTASIAKVLLGLDASDTVSYIPLSGLVCESVFVFGKFLFFIHAIILGFILNLFINTFLSKNNFRVLIIYSIIFAGLALGRAGTSTTPVYPFMIKTIFYLPIILYIIHKFTLKKSTS